MKVSFPANCQNISTTLSNTTTTSFPATIYEPKSVLDLRRSPSPASKNPIFNARTDISADPLADHALQINQHFVDWDSLMRELGLHDDSTPLNKPEYHTHPALPPPPAVNSNSTQFVPVDLGLLSDIPAYDVPSLLNHNHPNDFNSCDEFDYVDELIRLAECFDTNSVQLAHEILGRLSERLTSPIGKPLERVTFYFKEALQSQLTGSTWMTRHPSNSSFRMVQTIKAQNAFSSISPIPLFINFTANQTVLEALDGSTSIHVIDFDIGLGGHWASFMKELADKSGSRQAARLRISALVSEEYANESRLVRDNLTQFARELNIKFDIEFVLMGNFEYLSFKALKFSEGEKLAVLLSPVIFRKVGIGFLNDLRKISPDVVVQAGVEGELGTGRSSCRQAVIDGLDIYSTLLESLETADINGGGVDGEDDCMMRIETFVVFPKIMDAAGRQGMCWREMLVAAGLRQVGPSQFAQCQAESLLRRVQVRGFHVVKREAELVLCWHETPIVTTSAWRF